MASTVVGGRLQTLEVAYSRLGTLFRFIYTNSISSSFERGPEHKRDLGPGCNASDLASWTMLPDISSDIWAVSNGRRCHAVSMARPSWRVDNINFLWVCNHPLPPAVWNYTSLKPNSLDAPGLWLRQARDLGNDHASWTELGSARRRTIRFGGPSNSV